MLNTRRAVLRKVKRHDLLARWVVTLGGVVVIVSVLGILVMIVGTTLPLFLPARARLLAQAPLPAGLAAKSVLALGVDIAPDQGWQVAHAIDASGSFRFVDLATGKVIQELQAQSVAGDSSGKPAKPVVARKVLSAEANGPGSYTLRWSDGSFSLVDVAAAPRTGPAGNHPPQFALRARANIPADTLGIPAMAVMQSTGEKSSASAALYGGNRIVIVRRNVVHNEITDEETTASSRLTIGDDVPGRVTALAMDHAGGTIYAGTANGSLLWWRLDADQVVDHDVVPAFVDKRAITSLQLMLGDVTLVVGDAKGGVSNWFFVRPQPDGKSPEEAGERAPAASNDGLARTRAAKREGKKLTLIRTLPAHDAAIQDIVPSPRNRSLLVRDDASVATMDYTTSERLLATFRGVQGLAFSRRGDVVLTLAGDSLAAWEIKGSFFGLADSQLHPEVSWLSLCGRVWYEGHDAPEFSWQSTGGTDDYEAQAEPRAADLRHVEGHAVRHAPGRPVGPGRGRLRESFLFPCPAGLDQAVYRIDGLRSLGRARLPGRHLVGAADQGRAGGGLSQRHFHTLGFPLVPVGLAAGSARSPTAYRALRSREFLVAGLLLAVGMAVAGWFSSPVEQWLFGGNVTVWLSKQLGMVYDQRNSILIAFGVGFMVVPIIFTLAEDALSSVPHNMTAASMALGASRWQTVWRVVLPSASPGIFAAVMIGFGRAVGETMVFLMATGPLPASGTT